MVGYATRGFLARIECGEVTAAEARQRAWSKEKKLRETERRAQQALPCVVETMALHASKAALNLAAVLAYHEDPGSLPKHP